MDPRPVGIFDSDLGGLTVLREILRQCPTEACIYVADGQAAPYGSKSETFLQDRCAHIAEFLLEQGAKAIVVACNTASVVALPSLRERFAVPFVGMDPAVKPAAALTQSGTIGVLATTATASSERLARLIRDYANGVRVITRECPELVDLIEAGVTEGPEVDAALVEEVGPALSEGADVLVLACTHLPFLAPAIARLAGPDVKLVDPSAAVARQLQRILADQHIEGATEAGPPVYYSTGERDVFAARLAQLLGPLATPVRPAVV